MTEAPSIIYLQCYDEAGELLNLVHDDVTWCVDQINDRDAVYALASTHQQELNHLSRAIDHLMRLDKASQRMLARALHENRVKDECLELAMKALGGYTNATMTHTEILNILLSIEQRLAQLEPEEEG